MASAPSPATKADLKVRLYGRIEAAGFAEHSSRLINLVYAPVRLL